MKKSHIEHDNSRYEGYAYQKILKCDRSSQTQYPFYYISIPPDHISSECERKSPAPYHQHRYHYTDKLGKHRSYSSPGRTHAKYCYQKKISGYIAYTGNDDRHKRRAGASDTPEYAAYQIIGNYNYSSASAYAYIGSSIGEGLLHVPFFLRSSVPE